jgi:hypothetical protein
MYNKRSDRVKYYKFSFYKRIRAFFTYTRFTKLIYVWTAWIEQHWFFIKFRRPHRTLFGRIGYMSKVWRVKKYYINTLKFMGAKVVLALLAWKGILDFLLIYTYTYTWLKIQPILIYFFFFRLPDIICYYGGVKYLNTAPLAIFVLLFVVSGKLTSTERDTLSTIGLYTLSSFWIWCIWKTNLDVWQPEVVWNELWAWRSFELYWVGFSYYNTTLEDIIRIFF